MDHEAEPTSGDRGTDGAGTDALLAVRAQLDDVDELPLDARAEVFERTHEVVVEELRTLELG